MSPSVTKRKRSFYYKDPHRITVISIGRSPRTSCAPTSSDAFRAARNSSPKGRSATEDNLEEKTAKRSRKAKAVWPPMIKSSQHQRTNHFINVEVEEAFISLPKSKLRPTAPRKPVPDNDKAPDFKFWSSSPTPEVYIIPALQRVTVRYDKNLKPGT